MEEFIDKWQTLIGSALGVFLAIILAAIGFWVKNIIHNYTERKESRRRIEIGITRSLDDTFKTIQKLEFLVERLKTLTSDVISVDDDKFLTFESINFPTIRNIYSDTESPNFKMKSYYIHNKLLWADAGIKEINETIKNLKQDFTELLRKNELHITLMMQNKNPDPVRQRKAYADNLEMFAKSIPEFIDNFIKDGIVNMTQIKIYNLHLMKGCGFLYRWKQEGLSFRFFCKTIELKKVKELDALEKIDESIKDEVNEAIQKAENRAEELARKKVS